MAPTRAAAPPEQGDAARGFRPRALGEIAIRCGDPPRMMRFYEEVLGLQRLAGDHRSGIVFFVLGESFGGHTAVLALFRSDRTGQPRLRPAPIEAPSTDARSSLHHVALARPAAEQDAAAWFERVGQPGRVEIFGWIGWRGVFTDDPEGNTLELVAHDPAFLDPVGAR